MLRCVFVIGTINAYLMGGRYIKHIAMRAVIELAQNWVGTRGVRRVVRHAMGSTTPPARTSSQKHPLTTRRARSDGIFPYTSSHHRTHNRIVDARDHRASRITLPEPREYLREIPSVRIPICTHQTYLMFIYSINERRAFAKKINK